MQERQRIARELHDAVAQTLFSLRLTAQAAAALVRRDPDRAIAELDDRRRRWPREATDELRQIVAELRPPDLSREGLAETLRARVALLDRVHGASSDVHGEGCPKLAPKVEEAMLRVAEEALHNALQPRSGYACVGGVARPTATVVAGRESDDDGLRGLRSGSPANGVAPSRARSMRERSHAVHGTDNGGVGAGSGHDHPDGGAAWVMHRSAS